MLLLTVLVHQGDGRGLKLMAFLLHCSSGSQWQWEGGGELDQSGLCVTYAVLFQEYLLVACNLGSPGILYEDQGREISK